MRREPLARVDLLLLFVVLSAGLSLRWIGLGSRGLWWDELFSVVSSSTAVSPMHLWNEWMVDDSHPPGFQPLMWLWFSAVPPTEWWARVPSAVASSAGLLYAAFATRDVLSGPGRVLLTSLLAFSKLDVYYAQEARQYALVKLLSLILVHRVVTVWRDGGTRATWASLALLAAAASTIHYYALFLSGLLCLVLAGAAHRHRQVDRLLPALTLGTLCYLPGLYTFQHLVRTGNGGWQRRVPPVRFLSDLFNGAFSGSLMVSSLVVGGLLLVALLSRLRSDPPSLQGLPVRPLLAILVGAAVITACANHWRSVLHVRYYQVFLPPLFLLLAGVATHRRSPLLPVLPLLPLLATFTWYPDYQRYNKQGWRESARWVAERHHPDITYVVLGPDGLQSAGELLEEQRYNDYFWLRNQSFFDYYLQRSGVYTDFVRLPNDATLDAWDELSAPLVLLGGHHMKLSRPLDRRLRARLGAPRVVRFKSTRMWVFGRLPRSATRPRAAP